jgi:hypothetical protein
MNLIDGEETPESPRERILLNETEMKLLPDSVRTPLHQRSIADKAPREIMEEGKGRESGKETVLVVLERNHRIQIRI